jgi:ABC-2 type transport system permease protein
MREIVPETRIEDRGSRIGEAARSSILDPRSSILDPPSSMRAWGYLVWLCFVRQVRARQMVWIALGLLALTATVVGLNTVAGRWTMSHWRWGWVPANQATVTISDSDGSMARKDRKEEPVGPPPRPLNIVFLTYGETVQGLENIPRLVHGWQPVAAAWQDGIAAACRAALARSDFYVFANWVVFSVFVGFLLPIWSLSFATEALGGEREGRSLVWLLTRPLPRWSIYLAKFLGLLPWTLALNVGGFALLCVLAGRPGHQALRLFWPAVLGGTLAFSSLFHLMGALFRRAAVVALVYSFFLETILGTMPGYMKRISIVFYTRCLMFDAAADYGLQAEKPSIYLPVTGATAWAVLLGVTIVLLGLGMVIFARREYQDLT